MVNLTEFEQKMLTGQLGEFKQKALQFIVSYANVLGAKELCEISRATLFIGAQHYLEGFTTDDYNEIFSKFYLNSDQTIPIGQFDETCAVQTCVAACVTRNFATVHLRKEFFDKNNKFYAITREAGASEVHTCTPYFSGWIPLPGEHFVTTESSNVLLCNSVFGACGNADGIEAAVCSAICGRTPRWGLHIKEERYGNVVFTIQCPSATSFDWDVIGYTIGRFLPRAGKPVITGNFKRPDIKKLRQCFSSLATASNAEICHVVGITPEARTVDDALGGKKPAAYFAITQQDYDDTCRLVCDPGSGPVDFVSIGCPHLAIEEIRDIASYLRGKKVKQGVELWIWTTKSNQALADYNGFTKIIEESGAHLLDSTCPICMKHESHKHAKAMVLSGIKQAKGLRAQTAATVYCGETLTCIDAAIEGRWEAPA